MKNLTTSLLPWDSGMIFILRKIFSCSELNSLHMSVCSWDKNIAGLLSELCFNMSNSPLLPTWKKRPKPFFQNQIPTDFFKFTSRPSLSVFSTQIKPPLRLAISCMCPQFPFLNLLVSERACSQSMYVSDSQADRSLLWHDQVETAVGSWQTVSPFWLPDGTPVILAAKAPCSSGVWPGLPPYCRARSFCLVSGWDLKCPLPSFHPAKSFTSCPCCFPFIMCSLWFERTGTVSISPLATQMHYLSRGLCQRCNR